MQKKTLILFVILIVTSLSGVYYNNVKSARSAGDECDLTFEKCTFSDVAGPISVKFLSPIVTEEEILLDITLPESLVIQDAWIEGVNMYMGKTRIIRENDAYLTFLGSCNLARMQWRLELRAKNKNGQVTSYSAIFYTNLN